MLIILLFLYSLYFLQFPKHTVQKFAGFSNVARTEGVNTGILGTAIHTACTNKSYDHLCLCHEIL